MGFYTFAIRRESKVNKRQNYEIFSTILLYSFWLYIMIFV